MAEKQKAPAGSFFWQIVLPTLVGTIILLCGGIWVILFSSPGSVTRFAEISTVLMVIPVLFGSLLVMVLLGALIFLVVKIIQGLPPITAKILEILEQIQTFIEAVSKNAVTPIIRPRVFLAGFRRLFSKDESRVKFD